MSVWVHGILFIKIDIHNKQVFMYKNLTLALFCTVKKIIHVNILILFYFFAGNDLNDKK